MVLDLLERLSLLLLLLGLWGPMRPLYALPKNLTKAHWFEIQHIQPSPLLCNIAMGGVNNYTQHCKPQNTFLHDSFQNVATACKTPNIVCKNGQNNCHQSAKPVYMTDCRLTGGRYPACRYKDANQSKFFIIACDPPQKSDPPYQLVPVHLDKII
ncbi:ribonuclease K6 [Rousettus aegyptiacus]|uniref:Ribonuclease A family member k6 n=1 Tax=Rousettus aegyptiacus TaxID=9407 RepID=A0A7J8IR41_ROUAE|nr:ribonuclease K6 [Rousettus aegyptiacus]XP_016021014.1 ribonuclease K6 [Rousettus aegyptiacus]KAF6487063.1 ribonuclease A family member k6 [Rousettus aegyptiacus]